MKKNYQKSIIIISLVAVCIAIFFTGYLFGKKTNKDNFKLPINQKMEEVRQTGFHFINPLLECEIESLDSSEISFENKIKKELEEKMENNFQDVFYSVYFRNLKNGPWFGINEHEDFFPASLLKVPIMMAYFKKAESNPEILEERIKLKESQPLFNQKITPTNRVEEGEEYSISELIERMIIHSDNEALGILYGRIDEEYLKKVFSDLGVEMPNLSDANSMMSVKDYASFFRILYNSSYLNRSMSEKSLEILSRVEYKKGIVFGVPWGVRVSHKFGERQTNIDHKIVNQLHDCGIVYHEKYPYLLCVMTRGNDIEKLNSSIGKISKIIFEKINQNIN